MALNPASDLHDDSLPDRVQAKQGVDDNVRRLVATCIGEQFDVLRDMIPGIVQASLSKVLYASNDSVLASLDHVRRQLAERPQRFEQDVMDIVRPHLAIMEGRLHAVAAQAQLSQDQLRALPRGVHGPCGAGDRLFL